eukprot:7633436-Alexandrium_andersonii.AAC.1
MRAARPGKAGGCCREAELPQRTRSCIGAVASRTRMRAHASAQCDSLEQCTGPMPSERVQVPALRACLLPRKMCVMYMLMCFQSAPLRLT